MKTIQHSGYSLVELLVAGFAGTVILLALASALEVMWIHYMQAQHYYRVDNMLSVSEHYLNMQIMHGAGNYFWVPIGGDNKMTFYSHTGSNSIILEGKLITGHGTWLSVEDAYLFGYALIEKTPDVMISSAQGTANAKLISVNANNGTIQLSANENNSFWVNRGDTIETLRYASTAEVRDEKLWIDSKGYVSDGIIAFDIMFTSQGKSGYGIVQTNFTDESYVVCNYDANYDGKLTIDDDIDQDGKLDCISFEALERSKLDGIEYWILASLPQAEAKERSSPAESFVVGRKIYRISRNRYPQILNKKIRINNFEL